MQIFKDARYLDAAVRCGEVVWKRGLLRKGYGICHGVAGNAYGFLCLYKLTNLQKYLHRATKVHWVSGTQRSQFSPFLGAISFFHFFNQNLLFGHFKNWVNSLEKSVDFVTNILQVLM